MIELLKVLEETCKKIQKEVKDFEFTKLDYKAVIEDLKTAKQVLLSEIGALKEQKGKIEDQVRSEKSAMVDQIYKKNAEADVVKANVESERLKMKVERTDFEREKEQFEEVKKEYNEKSLEVARMKEDLDSKLKKHEEIVSALRSIN